MLYPLSYEGQGCSDYVAKTLADWRLWTVFSGVLGVLAPFLAIGPC